MTPNFRAAGVPSAIEAGTHDDADLRPAIEYAGPAAEELPTTAWDEVDDDPAWDDTATLPDWLVGATRMIRPICVGALLAIPTLGAATVGTVAIFSGEAADRAVRASTAFLAGIPIDVVVLIGTLATGYSLSKTVERLRGVRQ